MTADGEGAHLFRRVLEAVSDDDGEEGAEAVEDGYNCDLDEAVDPAFDVFCGFFDVGFCDVAGAAGVARTV
jgi:hypothetical protein